MFAFAVVTTEAAELSKSGVLFAIRPGCRHRDSDEARPLKCCGKDKQRSGINGRPIELVLGDTESDPTKR